MVAKESLVAKEGDVVQESVVFKENVVVKNKHRKHLQKINSCNLWFKMMKLQKETLLWSVI